jgi:hypothetical protein
MIYASGRPINKFWIPVVASIIFVARRIRWVGCIALMGENRAAYRVLVVIPVGKRILRRQRRRWEDNIKMYLQDMGGESTGGIDSVGDRDRCRAFIYASMDFRVP